SRFHSCARARKYAISAMSRMVPASPHQGSEASTARPAMTKTAKVRLARVARSTRASVIADPREQAVGLEDDDDHEHDVAGEHLPLRRGRRAEGLGDERRDDARAGRLRDAEDDAADQRAPQAPQPADDHR